LAPSFRHVQILSSLSPLCPVHVAHRSFPFPA
jgi:hypothetical protein